MSEADKKVKAVLDKNPSWGRHKIAKAAGLSPNTVKDSLSRVKPDLSDAQVDEHVLTALAKRNATLAELQTSIGCEKQDILESIARLRGSSHEINQIGTHYSIAKPGFERIPMTLLDNDGWIRIGLVSDTHLCCKEERLDALHAQYDLFEREGITTVLHAGNIVDGFIPGLNQESVFSPSLDGQVSYCIEKYPQRKNLVTHFITGDDHESWFMKQGLNFGKYLQLHAEEAGRNDLKYLSHVEADVEFLTRDGEGSTICKVMHPGGGSSYARSYTSQKIVESFQGGEKPHILIMGHYHVSNYMLERNIHCISMPGFEDQTIFARKKRLRMDVGGGLMEFKQQPNGTVSRFRIEWNMYFDRGYYKPFLKSDAILTKGHLRIKR